MDFEDIAEMAAATFSEGLGLAAPGDDRIAPPQPPADFEPPTLYSIGGRIEDAGINGRGGRRVGQEVLTGILVPQRNDAIIAGGTATHGTLFEWYQGEFGVPDQVLGFKAATTGSMSAGSGELFFEIPGGGGGLFQGLSMLGLTDEVQRITGASITKPQYLYECVYAARRFGLPESAIVRYGHRVRGSADPNFNETDEYELGDCYQEMRFDGILPDVFEGRRGDFDGLGFEAPEPDDIEQPPTVPDRWEPPRNVRTIDDRDMTLELVADQLRSEARRSINGFVYDVGETVMVGPRYVHHDDMYRQLADEAAELGTAVPSDFMPFTGANISGETHLEVPSAAEGLNQALRRTGGRADVTRVSDSPADLYVAAWVAAVGGMPEDTIVRWTHKPDIPDRLREVIAESDFDTSRKVSRYRLGDLYQELRFAGHFPDIDPATSLDAPRLSAGGEPDVPQSLQRVPGGRTAQTIIDGIREAGVTSASFQSEMGDTYNVEFNPEDQDPHYPSVVSIDADTGRITEVTLRFGPLGNRDQTDDFKQNRIEGTWFDIVADAGDAAIPDFTIDGRMIDLGDAYIAPELRPHFRLSTNTDGYDISPQEFVDFYDEVQTRFRDRFGTLEDRMAGMVDEAGTFRRMEAPQDVPAPVRQGLRAMENAGFTYDMNALDIRGETVYSIDFNFPAVEDVRVMVPEVGPSIAVNEDGSVEEYRIRVAALPDRLGGQRRAGTIAEVKRITADVADELFPEHEFTRMQDRTGQATIIPHIIYRGPDDLDASGPMFADVVNDGILPLRERFFQAIRREFGEVLNAPGEKVPREDLLDDLRRVADELGEAPTVRQYRERGRHSADTIRRRFDNYVEGLREAGLDPDPDQVQNRNEGAGAASQLERLGIDPDDVESFNAPEGVPTFLEQYEDRIESWPGTGRLKWVQTSGNDIVDWTFDWPGEAPAERSESRMDDVTASAVIFRDGGDVSEWQLRLPPIPATGVFETRDEMERLVNRATPMGSGDLIVRIADDGPSYTPHVHPRNANPDPDATFDTIEAIWTAYLEEYGPGQEMSAPEYGAFTEPDRVPAGLISLSSTLESNGWDFGKITELTRDSGPFWTAQFNVPAIQDDRFITRAISSGIQVNARERVPDMTFRLPTVRAAKFTDRNRDVEMVAQAAMEAAAEAMGDMVHNVRMREDAIGTGRNDGFTPHIEVFDPQAGPRIQAVESRLIPALDAYYDTFEAEGYDIDTRPGDDSRDNPLAAPDGTYAERTAVLLREAGFEGVNVTRGDILDWTVPSTNETTSSRMAGSSMVAVADRIKDFSLRLPRLGPDTYDAQAAFAISGVFDKMPLVRDRRNDVRRGTEDGGFVYHIEPDFGDDTPDPETLVDDIVETVELFRTRIREYEENIDKFEAPMNQVERAAEELRKYAVDVNPNFERDIIDFKLPTAGGRMEVSTVEIGDDGMVTGGLIRGSTIPVGRYNDEDVARNLETAIINAAREAGLETGRRGADIDVRIEGGQSVGLRPHADLFGDLSPRVVATFVRAMDDRVAEVEVERTSF